jgi:5'-nucleotidase / UDP-sugar diphosphatase
LGDIPGILLANYVNAKDKSDADFVKLFDDKTIVPYTIIERNGYKIGIISVLGKDADESIAGYINVSFSDIKKTAGKIARKLKEKDQVDLVVVLSHSGVEKDKKGNWAGEDVELAKSSPSIDIVISGHTHTYLSEPIKVGNAIVVQTGSHGSNMGKVEVTFDANRKPSFAFRMVPMDDNVMADAAVQSLIDDKNPWIEENILQGVGVKLSQVLFETSFPLKLDEKKPEVSNLGPFVADAVYHFLNKKHSEEVDLTIVATGVIRHDIVTGNTGKQNINDLFNVMPLGVGEGLMPGSPLGKIYISGNELKKVFELILTVYPSMNSYYLFFSGLEITYNPKKGLFKKISEMKVGSPEKGYRKVSFSKKDDALYAIAANKYILSFIGAIRKMSFGIVNVVGKDINGKVIENDDFLIDLDKNTEGIQEAKEWLALLEYVRSFPDINGNNIPDVPEKYRAKTNAVFVAK